MTTPELDKWIDEWKQTRQTDRLEAKKYPLFKKFVKEDTQIISRLTKERRRIERKYSK